MLPTSLEAATERMMRPGSIAREVLGDDFVDHFGGTREHEVKLWSQAVTGWEGKINPAIEKHAIIDDHRSREVPGACVMLLSIIHRR